MAVVASVPPTFAATTGPLIVPGMGVTAEATGTEGLRSSTKIAEAEAAGAAAAAAEGVKAMGVMMVEGLVERAGRRW